MLGFCACDKGKQSLVGDYSYKLSGELALTDSAGTVTYQLFHRNGQMNVLKDKYQKDRYIITMNEMNGGCYTATATRKGDSLALAPHEFTTHLVTLSSLPFPAQEESSSIVYRVRAEGGGVLNDGMLLLTETWSGSQSGAPQVLLSGQKMTIIAEKN